MNKESLAKSNALAFFGNALAADVWMKKYALKNNGEFIETDPRESYRRLSKEIARIDKRYNPENDIEEELYQYFVNHTIVLGGSNQYGIGNTHSLTSLGNCFVISDTTDSYGGIMKVDQEQIQLMKRRGGVGHDLSHIRPKGSKVNNAAGTSTGIVPFMERYSNSTREVAQDGRRGALMLTINITHPDTEDFLFAKNDLTKITGANISIKITDEFMRALESKESFKQQFVYEDGTVFEKIINPVDLWKKIIHQAWKSAEPGVLFIDKIINESPADCYAENDFRTVSTNPCGELPLCPYDSCRLLAINLFNIVKYPFTKDAFLDIAALEKVAVWSQIIMDNIIDLEKEKIEHILTTLSNRETWNETKEVEYNLWSKIYDKLVQGRRTGVGIMGLADAFAALGITYGSYESVELAEKIQRKITLSSYYTSIRLAEARGSFPIWEYEKEKDHSFINRILDGLWNDLYVEECHAYKIVGRRNIANLTIAPTGTISLLAGVSSGIEPVFNIYYIRKVKVEDKSLATSQDANGDYWKEYPVIHPKFLEWMKITYGDDLGNVDKMTASQLDELIAKSPYAKATAYEIDRFKKIDLQAAMQRWIDHSISVTHNLPKEVTEEEVSQLYRYAYEKGCKGITIYRDGSREGVLTIAQEEKPKKFQYNDAPKRPRDLPAELYHVKVKGEGYVVVVGLLDGKPYEIFCRKDDNQYKELTGIIRKVRKKRFDYITKHNGIPNLQDETNPLYKITTIYTSALLRHGTKPEFIIHMIDKFELDVSSLVSAIQRILKKYISDGTPSHEHCSECGEKLTYEGGCAVCKSCGYSKCG